MAKAFKILASIVIVVLVFIGFCSMMINSHVVNSSKESIVFSNKEENTEAKIDKKYIKRLSDFNPECILVLGAGIKNKQEPTPMLKDRLDTAVLLYKNGVSPKILLTGDNGTLTHNEIHVMLNYCLNKGIPKEDIFCDHAGFSTYDSMYRAKSIFKAKKIIIVTQTYHSYRAIYLGEKLGIKSLAVGSDRKNYSGQPFREIREVAARVKDFFKIILKAESKLGGEQYDLSGDGSITQGE